ncbi:hypothetical protein IV203_029034 [Nitzschia inconspicua]|uniref:Uncharacterized protein n=1 Tax=Nitzschia inconspicua TaxID=303405 RepID=A0A9K3LPU8_9STRA|nr:hypothetical protein IV203_029034 [Nitzschia inconspicua]
MNSLPLSSNSCCSSPSEDGSDEHHDIACQDTSHSVLSSVDNNDQDYLRIDDASDDDDIAVAAEAAANAVEEADAAAANAHKLMDFEGAEDPHNFSAGNEDVNDSISNNDNNIDDETDVLPICRICFQSSLSSSSSNRPLLHFKPAKTVPSTSSTSKLSLFEHVHVHIFCGKTAGILFQKNPHSGRVHTKNTAQWEIMSKAGIKNKHGTEKDVCTALALSRWAMLPDDQPLPPSKRCDFKATVKRNSRKKLSLATRQYFLLREFEANLEMVRQESLELDHLQHQHNLELMGTPSSPEFIDEDKTASLERQVLDSFATSFPGPDVIHHRHNSDSQMIDIDQFESSTSIEVPQFAAVAQQRQDFGVSVATSPTTTATTTTTTSPLPASPPLGSTYAHPFPPSLFDATLPMTTSETAPGIPLINFSTFPNAPFVHPLPGRPLAAPLKGSLSLPPTHSKTKLSPIKAGKTKTKLHPAIEHVRFDKHSNVMDESGKITCPCGGRHKVDDGSATARQSWRTHALTKQHQQWLLRSTT